MNDTARPQRILVIGAGYVGLVTAVGFASMGHDVDVVEVWPERYDALVAGRVPIFEAGLQEAFEAAVADGCLRIQRAPVGKPDMVMVCVGTPIGADGRSDLSQLRSALADLHEVFETDAPLDHPEHASAGRHEARRAVVGRADGAGPDQSRVPAPGHRARRLPQAQPGGHRPLPGCRSGRRRAGQGPVRGHGRAAPGHGRGRRRDRQERGQRVPRPQALLRQRDRLGRRGVRDRHRCGHGRHRPGPAHRRAVHAPGPRLRRQLPAQGAPCPGRVGHGPRPAHARDQCRVGGQPRPAGTVRRAHRRPDRRRRRADHRAARAWPSRHTPTTSATRRRWPSPGPSSSAVRRSSPTTRRPGPTPCAPCPPCV